MKIIDTKNAPGAIGPYSQAIVHSGMVFTSGQIPIDPACSEVVANDITGQTTQVMENLKAVLIAAGSDTDSVIKTTCFLSDMDNFAAFNEVYAKYFTGTKPARSCVAVKTLPKNVLVEVEAVGVVK